MINNIQSSLSPAASSTAGSQATSADKSQPEKATTTTDKSSEPALSTLARQLGASVMRAGLRDKTMTHDDLGKFALAQIEKLSGNTKEMNDAKRAQEIPKTSDPELLSRARKATEYISRMLEGDPRAKNPFAGLSREQLTLIAYDDSGDYTLNERRAAYEGIGELEQQWRNATVDRGNAEQARLGRAPKFFADVLEHYKTSPAIEKALNYPTTIIANLEGRIYEEKFIPGTPGRKPGRRMLDLNDALDGLKLPTRQGNDDLTSSAKKTSP